jgi:hypothetical protein
MQNNTTTKPITNKTKINNMAVGIQPEKLDDIQLALYLAQKNNDGQPLSYIVTHADCFLDWINEKRGKQTEKNRTSVSELLNNK